MSFSITWLVQCITRNAAELLLQAPRALFLLVLVILPWPYGAAHAQTEELFTFVLLSVFGAECFALLVSPKRRAETYAPLLPLTFAGLIVIYGVFLSLNVRWTFDSEMSRFIPIEPMLAECPGWIDQSICMRKVAIVSGALVALYFGLTLGADVRWRRALWWAIVVSGIAVSLVGIAQIITDAPAIFWTAGKRSSHFFGPFVYHANAGAFLNLSLPLVFARALVVLRKRDRAVEKFVWCSWALTLLTCSTITGSKGAMLIGILLCVGILLWWMNRRLRRGDMSVGALTVNVCIAVLSIGALSVAFGCERTLDRWSDFLGGTGDYAADRRLVYDTCVRIIKGEWVFGFGAGTFRHVFPHFTHHLGDRIEGVWLYAHQDYLQTIIEWGWIGACLWAGVFFGGLIVGVRMLRRRTEKNTSDWTYETIGLVSALAGILMHSFFDYPLQVFSLLVFALAICGALWSTSMSGRLTIL